MALELPGVEIPAAGRANLADVAAATAVGAPLPPVADRAADGQPGAAPAKSKGGRPAGRRDTKPRERRSSSSSSSSRTSRTSSSSAPRVSRAEFEAPAPGAPAAPPVPLDPERVSELARSIGATCGVVFGALGAILGDHWQLEAGQAEVLGEAWAPIAARHLTPETAGAAPYLAAAIVTAGVIVPRVRETRRTRADAAKLAAAETADAAPAGAPRSAPPGIDPAMIAR